MAKDLKLVLKGLGYVEATQEEIEKVADLEVYEPATEYIGDEDQEVYISKEYFLIEDGKSDIVYFLDMKSGDTIGFFKRA